MWRRFRSTSIIRFNAVALGMIETPLTASLLKSEASRQFSESMHPLGRVGRPEDVAEVMAYLLGPNFGLDHRARLGD